MSDRVGGNRCPRWINGRPPFGRLHRWSVELIEQNYPTGRCVGCAPGHRLDRQRGWALTRQRAQDAYDAAEAELWPRLRES